MKRSLCLAAFAAVAATSSFAQLVDEISEVVQVRYDGRTNTFVPMDAVAGREGPDIAWENFRFGTGTFILGAPGRTWTDHGDVATGTVVNGISFSYVLRANEQQQYVFAIYDNDNGGALGAADPNDPNTDVNDPNNLRQLLGAYNLGPVTVTASAHYQILADLEDPNLGGTIAMTGPDLDADGLTDFGYSYSTVISGASTIGPSYFGIGDNSGNVPPGAPGVDNLIWQFQTVVDPNFPALPPPLATFVGGFFVDADTLPIRSFACRLWADGACTDTDGDGICNSQDGCPTVADPNQEDADGDGHGDACDLCPNDPFGDNTDNDADGLGNPCDNCPDNFNPNQADCDADGLGDACDTEPGPGCVTGCPNPGCDDGGVDADFNDDCNVNLTDLATLLANFGTATGATNASGDTDANGDVVLTDLANTLARFGNVCTAP